MIIEYRKNGVEAKTHFMRRLNIGMINVLDSLRQHMKNTDANYFVLHQASAVVKTGEKAKGRLKEEEKRKMG